MRPLILAVALVLVPMALMLLAGCAAQSDGYQDPQAAGCPTQSQKMAALDIGLLNGPSLGQGFGNGLAAENQLSIACN